MDSKELEKYVLQKARQFMIESKEVKPDKKVVKESVEPKPEVISSITSPKQIRQLAEEMKRLNKTIDLRNPLINPSGEDIINNILEEDKKPEAKPIVEESTKNRWKTLLDYQIPNDEKR